MISPWWVPVLLVLAAAPWMLRRSVPAPSTGVAGRSDRRPAAEDARVDAAVLADILGAAIQAGASIPASLAALGRAVPGEQGHELQQVAATLRLGGDWSAAWARAGQDLQTLNRALYPSWTDGVAPGGLLRHAAAQIRRRRAEEAREAAARLGVRLVLPMGLCWLPAFVLLGLAPVLLSTGGSLWP